MRIAARPWTSAARAIGIVCLVALIPHPAAAQTAGALQGTVVDVQGRPVAGATVAVTGVSLPAAGRGAITDASGAFRIAALPPGRNYRVAVSFPGLASIVQSDIVIDPGGATTVTLALPPASAVRERVEVHANSQIVNPASTEVETRVTSEFLDALPIIGRNYQDALTIAPGVTDVEGTGNPNIHGARDTDVVTLLDGVSTTDPLTGKIGAQLN